MDRPEEQLRQFSESVFEPDDLIELRLLPARSSSWCPARRLPDAGLRFVPLNRAGQNVYVGANPRTGAGGTTAADVALARCLFADFDHLDEAEARKRLAAVRLPEPTLIVDSGHGVHTYWRLALPMIDLIEWSAMQRRLIAALDSDKSIHDAPRIMRLPGFVNCKRKPHVPCRIIEAEPRRRQTLASLQELLPELAPVVATMAPWSNASSLLASPSAILRAARYVGRIPGAVAGQHGHDRTFHAACTLLRFGLTPEQAWPLLVEWNNTCQPVWSEHDLRRKLAEAQKHTDGASVGRRVSLA